MKLQLTILSLLIIFNCNGQISGIIPDTSYFDGCNWITCKGGNCMTTLIACSFDFNDLPPYDGELPNDSLTAERLIEDSLGNHYMIEYRYTSNDSGFSSIRISRKYLFELPDSIKDELSHTHYIALVNIIKYNGNKQVTIMKNIKAIYSPTECSADSPELWRKKIYEILKTKKQ